MLLRHGHMRPRPRPTLPPATATPATTPVSTLTVAGPRPLTGRHGLLLSNGAGDAPDDDALTVLRGRERTVPRHVSKSCGSLKRYGPRLSLQRRARRAERVVAEDVERLKQTLELMDRRLSLLDSITLTVRQNAEAAAVAMVRDYFHHLKRGLNPRERAYDREVTTPFLEAIMSRDLKCQDFCGLHHFFRQWEYVTRYHAAVEAENTLLAPLPFEQDALGDELLIIKTAGLTHCRISRDTLEHFFPHILDNDALVQRLIGKTYSYGFTMVLHVNSAGQVFQLESRIDLTSGLLTLLSDPLATLQMLESSMWTQGGNLRGEVQEQQIPIENGVLL